MYYIEKRLGRFTLYWSRDGWTTKDRANGFPNRLMAQAIASQMFPCDNVRIV